MSKLDRFQFWTVEVLGTFVFLVSIYCFVKGLIFGFGSSFFAYLVGIFIGLVLMGHRTVAKSIFSVIKFGK